MSSTETKLAKSRLSGRRWRHGGPRWDNPCSRSHDPTNCSRAIVLACFGLAVKNLTRYHSTPLLFSHTQCPSKSTSALKILVTYYDPHHAPRIASLSRSACPSTFSPSGTLALYKTRVILRLAYTCRHHEVLLLYRSLSLSKVSFTPTITIGSSSTEERGSGHTQINRHSIYFHFFFLPVTPNTIQQRYYIIRHLVNTDEYNRPSMVGGRHHEQEDVEEV